MALDFVAGCVGGCAGVVVGHPLDTLKVHMQLHGAKYGGSIACMKTLIAQDSFRALYRGVTSPLTGVAFVNAIVFGAYGAALRRTNDPTSPWSQAAAGAAAGLAQSVACSPVELAKTRLQLGASKGSPLSCLMEIARKEGPTAIFRGLGLTALRDAPAFATYFLSYELMTKTNDGSQCGVIRTLIAGGLAGTASWLVTFPIDSLKSRIQADGLRGPRLYTGALDCLRKSVAAEGWSFLTRGLGPVLLRAFPSNAACFGAVSWCLKLEDKIQIQSPVASLVIGPNYAAHAYRSLLFAGAFSEAICAKDIRDMHEDFHSLEIQKYITESQQPCIKIGIIKENQINS